jgi:hypothetical protein
LHESLTGFGEAGTKNIDVLRDVPILVTAEELLQSQQRNRLARPNPALRAAAEGATALGRTLVQPAAVVGDFEVRGIDGERIDLSRASADGAKSLTIGAHVELLVPARRVIAAVATIGPALERRVSELSAEGETLLAYMLDCFGVMALGAVGEALRRLAEQRATELGWGVSPALSPGSLEGWPVEGQRELCALLPLEEIGVRLTHLYVLEPHKSVSMIIGLGPGYESKHVGSLCRFCSLAETCWTRRDEA